MKHPFKRILSALLASLMLLPLAACGDTDSGTPDTTDPADTTTAPAETTANTSSKAQTESIPIPSTFSIHFIDVGQADAALVE